MALFDSSIPADVEAVKLGAQRIRELKSELDTIFGVYLNDDGTFKNNVVTGAALIDATVTTAKLASGVFPVLQTPTGSLIAFAGSVAPANWAFCDGSSQLRTDPVYAALFAIIGTTYGSADSTHFNLPDLRGRVPVGLDAGQSRSPTIAALGNTDGASTHTLSAAESGIPDHTHDMPGGWVASSGGTKVVGPSGGAQAFAGGVTGGVTGGGAAASSAHQNLQPSIGVNYIIRL